MNIVETNIKDETLDKNKDVNKAKKNNDECIELKILNIKQCLSIIITKI